MKLVFSRGIVPVPAPQGVVEFHLRTKRTPPITIKTTRTMLTIFNMKLHFLCGPDEFVIYGNFSGVRPLWSSV